MSHDHVGVARFVENGFSIKEKTFCFNIHQQKLYQTSIDRLGVENNYYDIDVEKNLLAAGIEKQFWLFYKDFCGTRNPELMIGILKNNKELVTQYFSFMYFRSKKILEQANNEGISSKYLRKINHSEILRLQSIMQTNPLQMIGNSYDFYPVINFSRTLFINNSIGFGMKINKNKEVSIFIPLNIRVGILITNDLKIEEDEFYYIEPTNTDQANNINIWICNIEKYMGNGFIFGTPKELIASYINHLM